MDNNLDSRNLFQSYLDVCNRALDANKSRFPFMQILSAARSAEQNRKVEVQIIEDRPSTSYVMEIKGDRIVARDHGLCAACDCDAQWRVARSYLEDVVRQPDVYISNPAKIDWEWMYEARRA